MQTFDEVRAAMGGDEFEDTPVEDRISYVIPMSTTDWATYDALHGTDSQRGVIEEEWATYAADRLLADVGLDITDWSTQEAGIWREHPGASEGTLRTPRTPPITLVGLNVTRLPSHEDVLAFERTVWAQWLTQPDRSAPAGVTGDVLLAVNSMHPTDCLRMHGFVSETPVATVARCALLTDLVIPLDAAVRQQITSPQLQ